MSTSKKKILLIFLTVVIALSVAQPLLAQNAVGSYECDGGRVKGSLFLPCCASTGKCSICEILSVIVYFIEWVWRISAVVALVLLVFYGLGLITSQGNSDKVSKAKSGIVQTLVALVIIFASWLIINTVFTAILAPGSTIKNSSKTASTKSVLGPFYNRNWYDFCVYDQAPVPTK